MHVKKKFVLSFVFEMLLAVLRIRIRSDPVFLGHSDPDPGKYRIWILYPQKDPCNLIFLLKYHCLKYSFVQKIFIFDFKCHKMIRFGKKMP